MITLTQLESLKIDVRNQLQAHRTEAARIEEILSKKLAAVDIEIKQCLAGINIDLKVVAEGLLAVRGRGTRHDHPQELHKEVQELVNAFKEALLSGDKDLHREYFGLKHYDCWSFQRSDHPVGMGPRYGSVVFSLHLKIPQSEIPPCGIDAILYYLGNLATIQGAQSWPQ